MTVEVQQHESRPINFRVLLPLGLILAMVTQLGGLIWWGATISGDVRDLNRRVVYAEERENKTDDKLNDLLQRNIRIEDKVNTVIDRMQEMKTRGGRGWKP